MSMLPPPAATRSYPFAVIMGALRGFADASYPERTDCGVYVVLPEAAGKVPPLPYGLVMLPLPERFAGPDGAASVGAGEVTPAAPPAEPAPAPVKAPGCCAAVLRALVRADRPLTRDAVIDALADAHESYSESAVDKTLAQLVQLHVLDNPTGVRPRGYRLADG